MRRQWQQRIGAVVAAVAVFVLSGITFAQAAELEPARVTGDGWQLIDPDVEEEAEPRYVVFILLDNGTILEVGGGADVVWTPSEDADGVFTGQSLIPLQGVEMQATLTLIDEDTRTVTSTTQTGALTLESEITYMRTDMQFEVWIEQSRDLSEYSLFGPCLGVELRNPPRTFARVDPILPVAFDEAAGTLTLGLIVLSGDGGTFERRDTSPFGTFTQVISQTAVTSDEAIALSYHAIADDRDDCEVTYESAFVPFDGDFDVLFEAANELAEE